MSASQRLGEKSITRLERAIGVDILRAWPQGRHLLAFVATAHRHGWFDKTTGEWGWQDNPRHYLSCTELFPEEMK